jgi:hypothetical protein
MQPEYRRSSLAVDLLRIAMNERGHLARRGDLAYGVWGAHLIDLVLAGAAEVREGSLVRLRTTRSAALHDLPDAKCLRRLAPELPRPLRETFYKDVAPLTGVVAEVERYLEDSMRVWRYRYVGLGVFKRRRRYDVDPGIRATLLQPGSDQLRTAALRALAGMSTVTVSPAPAAIPAGLLGAGGEGPQVNALLAVTDQMRASAFSNSVNHAPTGPVGGAL